MDQILEDRVRGDFRLAMRGVAATVMLVSARDEAGQPHGMVATAFNSVSLDPPTSLLCVNSEASIVPTLLQTRSFCVNVLGDTDMRLCRPFSRANERHLRFAGGSWADHDGAPFLMGALSSIFCRLVESHRYGSHIVVMAGVHHVRLGPDAPPLIYCCGGYRSLGEVVYG